MLVLSRRPGERILLTTSTGDEIWLEVVKIPSQGKVSLGFSAPPSVKIEREETLNRDSA